MKFTVARASHAVIPSFYSLAVAMAAYEMGYAEASRSIVEPTNASRKALRGFLETASVALGQGYYAFINVGKWLAAKGWADSEAPGQYLAEQHGVAVVPGVYFSEMARSGSGSRMPRRWRRRWARRSGWCRA